jgi:light-regulated signal transduction histidine kinase (bacteriophytochrome)
MFVPDLTNCDREPIHIPGKVQDHGFLLAIDKAYLISYCSENISRYLPTTAQGLLGYSVGVLDTFLQKTDPPDFLIQLIKLSHTENGFEPPNPYPLKIKGEVFNVILSTSGDYYLLEFEPELSHLKSDIQRIIGSSLSEMLADTNLSRLLSNATEQIKKIIGYDRVMIYKFHEDGHGEVVSEVKNDDLEPFFGLHYPASDIPKQARELYKINLTRLISNVNDVPSAILTLNDVDGATLDLTDSVLRAVSPIHIQYLKNMGVASSFSISLLHQGELWGLVACHNYSPRFINYKEREAAKLIGQVLSSALSFRLMEEDKHKTSRFTIAVDTLTKQLLRDSSISDALLGHEVKVLHALDSTGAVLVFENQTHAAGECPDEEAVKELVRWLDQHMEQQLYETSQLPLVFTPALKYKRKASGLLACRLSKELKEYMLWFRPEVIRTISWAGDPNKPVELNPEGQLQISPRKSFETWAQTVENTALPWKKQDVSAAMQLKDEISFAISRKATEIRLLNERLKVAYDELDAFSYTISHDLKNPLSSIKSYSQLLTRKFDLEPNARHMVERISNAAGKMQDMITEVLGYSQVGQAKRQHVRIDMEQMVQELKQELQVSNASENLEINIGQVLDVYGDETMIMQVFSNLLGNAVKYSSKTDHPKVWIDAADLGDAIQYAVRDNGIGIRIQDQAKIFDLFTRSSEVNGFEGSGVGLSIVKKIMERHHGKIWVESDGLNGSTFYVQFRKEQFA